MTASLEESVDAAVPPSGTGCVECDAAGGWWVHLRRCALCGHVGCCDDSPGTHARKHWESTGHRAMQSFEPGEDWYWDFAEGTGSDGPDLVPPTSRPADQGVPGPLDRLPPDVRRRSRL